MARRASICPLAELVCGLTSPEWIWRIRSSSSMVGRNHEPAAEYNDISLGFQVYQAENRGCLLERDGVISALEHRYSDDPWLKGAFEGLSWKSSAKSKNDTSYHFSHEALKLEDVRVYVDHHRTGELLAMSRDNTDAPFDWTAFGGLPSTPHESILTRRVQRRFFLVESKVEYKSRVARIWL
ncbi:uncharacterized protein C8Q71DRAFT_754262 [Rhodofomes roseus]|uniref:Uncharacterized protein n=1 Tax=Rhodofomes roseus TaxID=34475 RepID=A0ABQ8KIT3_9APHY|nr:uncharacterized protein C8Q71DRAFT_754262 [Rhodofomes roseus]KAH9837745.1 hypothetical protein C8Q71DRAFT_754262 [Rhodofomes roseus]